MHQNQAFVQRNDIAPSPNKDILKIKGTDLNHILYQLSEHVFSKQFSTEVAKAPSEIFKELAHSGSELYIMMDLAHRSDANINRANILSLIDDTLIKLITAKMCIEKKII